MEFQQKIESLIKRSVNNILNYSSQDVSKLTFADITRRTKSEMNDLGCKLLTLIVSMVELSFDATRNKHQIIIRNKGKKRTLLTEMGEVEVKHTLYCDKASGRHFFAVDEILKLEKGSRIEQGMKAKLVSDATLMSYGKASALANRAVSRQTVHNLVKNLDSIEAPMPKTNFEAPNIYIEADEDHIHLNDGKATEVKLVYVHEGRENTNGNIALVNPRYFTSAKRDPMDIWDSVSDYLIQKYRCNKSNVHLSGDGASWIKEGLSILPNMTYHLDKFHLHRALMTLSRGDMRLLRELTDSVYNGDEERFHEICERYNIVGRENRNLILYISSNMEYVSNESRCSAEGHVSHVLSARMSSRPMGWSLSGAERMAKLRAFLFNKGDFNLLFQEHKRKKPMQKNVERKKRAYNAPSAVNQDDQKSYIEPCSIPCLREISAVYSQQIKNILKIF